MVTPLCIFLASPDAIEVMFVTYSLTESALALTLLMWPWWVKIPTEDFTDETLVSEDTYGDDVREIVVLVMEVDKVADEVTDVEIDK